MVPQSHIDGMLSRDYLMRLVSDITHAVSLPDRLFNNELNGFLNYNSAKRQVKLFVINPFKYLECFK